MSIAEQIATPTPTVRTRRPRAPMQPAPARRTVSTLVRIGGLIAVTALGAALMVGTVAIGIMMVASNLGG